MGARLVEVQVDMHAKKTLTHKKVEIKYNVHAFKIVFYVQA